MSRDQQIERAAKMLRRIDRNVGERTVGERRGDAAACAREVGLTVEQVGSEKTSPTVAEIVARSNELRS